MLKISTLILTCLVFNSFAMYISFTQTPVCFIIEDEPGKQIRFFYEVFGSQDHKQKVTFTPLNNTQTQQHQFENAKNSFTFIDASMKVCFRSLEKMGKSATIEFYAHDSAQLMELALKSEVYQLHDKLISIGEKIKEVVKDEEFEEVRHTVQSEIIVDQEGRVQKFAIGKLILIVIVAFAQLYLLKALLKKRDQGYHPV